MAYGMNQLRKAGGYLLDRDADYAKAMASNAGTFGRATRGTSLRDAFDTSGQVADSPIEKLAMLGVNIGFPAANIASRYALPAGGITLAGAGLLELTGAMNEQTSGTIMPN